MSQSMTQAMRGLTYRILPCPFCGNIPVVMGSGERARGLMIHCIHVPCVNPSVSYYDHTIAMLAWNQRRDGEAKIFDPSEIWE